MAISDKLTYLNNTKVAIHDAIVAKGVDIPVGSTFRSYADKISNISTASEPGVWSQSQYDAVFQSMLDSIPAEWLTIPTLISTDQKVHILIAVFDTDSNFTAFTCAGDYTVDWGDGTSNNYASGVKAEHEYVYDNTNLNSDTVANYGYKQCLLTITPQSGQNLTSIDFDQYHSSIGSGTLYDIVQPFVAISIAGSSLYTLNISQTGSYVNFNKLKYFRLEQNLIPSMSGLLKNCSTLSIIPLLNTSNTTNISSLFLSCIALTTIPLLDTHLVTNMNNIFSTCSSLTTIPLLDTHLVTNMNNMFNNCSSLINIPLINTISVINMSYMFNSCATLSTIPLINTSSVTDMSYMFGYCYSLTTIPLLDTHLVTNMNNMLGGCKSLISVPLLNTSAVTNMSGFLNACPSLDLVPAFIVSSVTNMSSIVSGSYSLKRIKIPITFTNSIANLKLSATALNEIYTNLPTKTGQTLTVTGNWGTTSDNPSIATAKGWTITG